MKKEKRYDEKTWLCWLEDERIEMRMKAAKIAAEHTQEVHVLKGLDDISLDVRMAWCRNQNIKLTDIIFEKMIHDPHPLIRCAAFERKDFVAVLTQDQLYESFQCGMADTFYLVRKECYVNPSNVLNEKQIDEIIKKEKGSVIARVIGREDFSPTHGQLDQLIKRQYVDIDISLAIQYHGYEKLEALADANALQKTFTTSARKNKTMTL